MIVVVLDGVETRAISVRAPGRVRGADGVVFHRACSAPTATVAKPRPGAVESSCRQVWNLKRLART